MSDIDAEVFVFQKGSIAWPELVVEGCGYEECGEAYRRSFAAAPFFCVERVLEGEGWLSDGEQRWPIAAGDCFFYGGRGSYSFGRAGGKCFRKIWIRYSGEQAGQASMSCLGSQVGVISDSQGGALELAFESCRGEAEKPYPDSAETLAGYLQVILVRLRRLRLSQESRENPSDRLFTDFKALIDENYLRWRSAKWGAKRLPASESYLSRIFRARMGMSPHRYLVYLKMQHALLRLSRSDWSVKRIAAELGYDDPLYFSRAFRKEFGCSPSSMREAGG